MISRRAVTAASLALTVLALAPAAFTQPAPLELRVMTLNIWYGGEQVNFASVAEVIRAATIRPAQVMGMADDEPMCMLMTVSVSTQAWKSFSQ